MPGAAKRNPGFDCLRLLCAFCVVCIHIPYPYKHLVEVTTRFAVPVFFIVSGWFYSQLCSNHRQHIYLKKIVRIFLLANIATFAFWLICRKYVHMDTAAYVSTISQASSWILYLLLNKPIFNESLWYLGAMVYVLLIVNVADRISSRKKLYPLIPLLLGMNLILGNYSMIFFRMHIPLCCSRNFLFAGLPFFLIGDKLRQKTPKWSNTFLLAALSLSLGFGLMENYILYKTGLQTNIDLYLFTPLTAISLFLLTANNPGWFETRVFHHIATLGKDLSLWIYILHPLIIQAVTYYLWLEGSPLALLASVYTRIGPILIFTLTSLIAAAICKCANMLKKNALSRY